MQLQTSRKEPWKERTYSRIPICHLIVWLGASTDGLIRKAAEQRANRLTHAEFEREATWATRKFVPFVMQRISVAVQIAAATEIRQALGRGMGPDSA